MLSEKARQALFDIRENGELVREFVAGLSFGEFQRDRRTFYAVTRALEIISEAARRLPPELGARGAGRGRFRRSAPEAATGSTPS